MKRVNFEILLVFIIVIQTFTISGCGSRPARTSGNLTRELYIWQRSWTSNVRESISHATENPNRVDLVVYLAAEISFDESEPRIFRAEPNYESLIDSGIPVGAAFRIGPYSGPFERGNELTELIIELATEIVDTCEREGVDLTELQMDFDCAESKLGGYSQWVDSVRDAISPVPLVITVLPSWMNSPGFKPLVSRSDGFILQVHSLAPPESPDSDFTLCNTDMAFRWIDKAANYGVPYRVALPTYGYTLAFSGDDEFIGLNAEGPTPTWPIDSQIRVVRSEPAVLSKLVNSVMSDHPELLDGIIWYRMPANGDRLNWTWPTLNAVMEGREPHSSVTANVTGDSSGLFDLSLTNDGEMISVKDVGISINWDSARLLAYDLLEGFDIRTSSTSGMVIESELEETFRTAPLKPGDEIAIGWLRFDNATDIDVSVVTQ